MSTTKKKKPAPAPAPAPAPEAPPPEELNADEAAALEGATREAIEENEAAAPDPLELLPLPARVRVTLSAVLMGALSDLAARSAAAGRFNAAGDPEIDPEAFFSEAIDPFLQVLAVDVQGLGVYDLDRLIERLSHWWTSPAPAGVPEAPPPAPPEEASAQA